MVEGERAAGEERVDELPATVEEADGSSSSRGRGRAPPPEREPGAQRVDRHPHPQLKPVRARLRGLPGDTALAREGAPAASGAEPMSARPDFLRKPEPAADAPREGGDRQVGVAFGERTGGRLDVGVHEEKRLRRSRPLTGGQRLLPAPRLKRITTAPAPRRAPPCRRRRRRRRRGSRRPGSPGAARRWCPRIRSGSFRAATRTVSPGARPSLLGHSAPSAPAGRIVLRRFRQEPVASGRRVVEEEREREASRLGVDVVDRRGTRGLVPVEELLPALVLGRRHAHDRGPDPRSPRIRPSRKVSAAPAFRGLEIGTGAPSPGATTAPVVFGGRAPRAQRRARPRPAATAASPTPSTSSRSIPSPSEPRSSPAKPVRSSWLVGAGRRAAQVERDIEHDGSGRDAPESRSVASMAVRTVSRDWAEEDKSRSNRRRAGRP